MVQFYPVHRSDINKGNFPLNHDVILKVCYYRDCPLRKAYFTTRSADTGVLCDVISKLPMVRAVEVVPIEQFNDTF